MTILTPNDLSTCCDKTQFTDIHLQNKNSYKIRSAGKHRCVSKFTGIECQHNSDLAEEAAFPIVQQYRKAEFQTLATSQYLELKVTNQYVKFKLDSSVP